MTTTGGSGPQTQNSLHLAFTKEKLEEISRWAVGYSLDQYGFVPGFEHVDLGLEMSDSDSEEGSEGSQEPWGGDMNRGDSLMARPNRRPQDVDAAIACYQRARDMIPRETHAVEWSECNAALGVAYSEREVEGNAREDSLDKAIECLTLAVPQFQTSPQQLAEVTDTLGTCYLERERGERPENLAQAIESFQKCLEIYTEAAFPEERAMVTEKLQTAYMEAAGLIEDEAADDYADSGFYD